MNFLRLIGHYLTVALSPVELMAAVQRSWR